MKHQHEIEMSISHQDFFRLLPFALKNLEYEVFNHQIRIKYHDTEIEIKLGEEGERRIASLTLPVVHVKFMSSRISDTQFKNFLLNFNKAYQRGGG